MTREQQNAGRLLQRAAFVAVACGLLLWWAAGAAAGSASTRGATARLGRRACCWCGWLRGALNAVTRTPIGWPHHFGFNPLHGRGEPSSLWRATADNLSEA